MSVDCVRWDLIGVDVLLCVFVAGLLCLLMVWDVVFVTCVINL